MVIQRGYFSTLVNEKRVVRSINTWHAEELGVGCEQSALDRLPLGLVYSLLEATFFCATYGHIVGINSNAGQKGQRGA